MNQSIYRNYKNFIREVQFSILNEPFNSRKKQIYQKNLSIENFEYYWIQVTNEANKIDNISNDKFNKDILLIRSENCI